MAGRHRRLIALGSALVVLALAPGVARASERSELLVARARAAYNAGRFEDARRDFADAAAADPRDAAAAYGLGRALVRLGRLEEAGRAFEQALASKPDFAEAKRELGLVSLRLGQSALEAGDTVEATRLLDRAVAMSPGLATSTRALTTLARTRGERPSSVVAPGKQWGFYAGTGVGYDSNVKLDPHGAGTGFFTLDLGGHYDPLRRGDAMLRLQYDFYQTLNTDAGSFDFRANEVGGTGAYAIRPWLWANLQALYGHYALGSSAYMQEPIITPYLTLLEPPWGQTQGMFRFEYRNYLAQPFRDIRDGPDYTAGVNQFLFRDPEHYLTLGFQFENEQPRSMAGNDFRQRAYQVHAGIYFPAWWQTSVALTYLFQYDDYPELNSFVAFRTNRVDHEHVFFAEVSRVLSPHLNLALTYYGTINNSNIPVFQYRRSVVLAQLQVVY